MIDWLILAGIGRLFIYLWQKFPLPQILENKKTIKQLHECPLCSGVWIYSGLAYFMHMNLFDWYFPVVTEVLVGGLISFIVHLFVIGWKDYFAPDLIIE